LSHLPDVCTLGATLDSQGSARFRVWAPLVQQIALRMPGDDRLLPMTRAGGGYYDAIVPKVAAGTRYFYRLNNSVDRPDPASRFQPDGIHGPSAVVSSEFPWTDASWRGLAWDDHVIYETHVGTFSERGTFAAMIDELDELVRLGVTALELMPVAQFPGGRNWGYDGVHHYAPQNTYGGPTGLKSLIDACHARSLAVILDVVYNHLGPEGNYLHEFGPYFTHRYHTPWGPAINFDGPESDAVREFFIGNALYWLREYHIDALRLDATHAIFDRSARPLLRELAEEVRHCSTQLGRPAYLIAENNANDPRILAAPSSHGLGLDAVLHDDFQRSLHALLTGERGGYYGDFGRVTDFGKAVKSGFVLDGQYSNYRRRHWGAVAADLPANKFVAYAQCHDSVGNRPRSERLGQLIDLEALKLAAAATILSPAIPFLFMGEEYDDPAPFNYFISHLDPKLAAAVGEGRRREFAAFDWKVPPPDPQAPESFLSSHLTRSLSQIGRHSVLWKFYQELLRLRKSVPAIRQSSRQHQHLSVIGDKALVVHRRTTESEICLCYLFDKRPLKLTEGLPTEGQWQLLLDTAETRWDGPHTSSPSDWRPGSPLALAPQSCVILKTRGLTGQNIDVDERPR